MSPKETAPIISEADKLKAEINDLNCAVQESKMPLSKAEVQVLTKEAQIRELEYQDLVAKTQPRIDQLKLEINDLNRAVQESKMRLSQAEEAVLAKEKEIHDLEEKMALSKPADQKPEVAPETAPENAKPTEAVAEAAEKPIENPAEHKDNLGYLDIDPAKILESLSPEELTGLKNLQGQYFKAQEALNLADLKGESTEELKRTAENLKNQINDFYKVKLEDILKNTANENALSEEEMARAAESISQVIEQTVELEASQEMAKLSKKLSPIAQKMLKNGLIIAGTAAAVGSLGIPGVGAVVAVAGGTTLARFLLSKMDRSKGQDNKNKQKFEQDFGQAKDKALENLFGDIEGLRRKMSGHISNVLRAQTSERAMVDLKGQEEATEPENVEFSGKLKEKSDYDYYRKIYLQALTKVRAEYPDKDPEEQRKMAIMMAVTLGQHQRNESKAAEYSKALKTKKPAVFALIEKYNAFLSGETEDKSVESQVKQAAYSIGLGTAIGMAVRTSGMARVVMGAVSGAGMGLAFSEAMTSKEQGKVFKELEVMLSEAEKALVDVEFPVENLEEFRQQRVMVESRLQMGILDANPLLKSRAENFIHQVQKLEMLQQENLAGVLTQISENSKNVKKQRAQDLERLESKIKKKRWLYVIGGAALGAGAAWAAGEFLGKDDKHQAPAAGDAEHGKQAWQDINNLYDKPDQAEVSPQSEFPMPGEPAEAAVATHFEDTIQSHDSIWESTKNIFEQNHEKLGYTGDPNDQQALDAWAERQTANAVNDLRFEQGGNLADLVHEGDKVSVDYVDGHAKLHFEASSGIEPGHLSEAGLETGAPAAEVTPAAETTIQSPPAAEVPTAPEAVSYEMAKATGQIDQAFHKVLGSQDQVKIDEFVHDYFKDQHMSDNKRQIFSGLLHGTKNMDQYDGSVADLVKNFDAHVRDNFDELKSGPKNHWMVAKVGDTYTLIKRVEGRWGLANYQLDTDGDGLVNKTIGSNVQMREAFKKGRF